MSARASLARALRLDLVGDAGTARRTTQPLPVVPLPSGSPVPPQPVPGCDGLDIVTSIRAVREREDMRGIPVGTRAV